MWTKSLTRLSLAGAMAVVALAPLARADDLRLAIAASNKEFEAAASKGDSASLALLYTPDAQLPAGKLVDRGKYVVIWKRDGGKWKLHRDIWTTSLAPAKP